MRRIIFIGFSFGRANMQLFRQALEGFPGCREVYATTYNIYPEAVVHTSQVLKSLFSPNHFDQIHLHDDKSATLFDRYDGVF